MAYFDLPLDALKQYLPVRQEPEDFDQFWQNSLAQARRFPLSASFEKVDFNLTTLDSYDVTFSGFGGQPIKAWFQHPKHASGPIGCVIEFIGYGGGRGYPTDWLFWPSMGYAHFVMDTRGQGSSWRIGDTPDLFSEPTGPHIPGFMTLGVMNPECYYYRRVFVDAVRAVEAACQHQLVDTNRLAATGSSQGGGIALAAAGLEPSISVVMPDVPFLCHYRRAAELVDTDPYAEISRFCHIHRDKVETVFANLAYFDGVNFAAHSKARALFSTSLMDTICPPSTVFAAYNHFLGPKEIRVYSFNGHEGGGTDHALEKAKFIRQIWT
jgi:cephalosporin-C deacetylase